MEPRRETLNVAVSVPSFTLKLSKSKPSTESLSSTVRVAAVGRPASPSAAPPEAVDNASATSWFPLSVDSLVIRTLKVCSLTPALKVSVAAEAAV